jgi:hypothetical protein
MPSFRPPTDLGNLKANCYTMLRRATGETGRRLSGSQRNDYADCVGLGGWAVRG